MPPPVDPAPVSPLAALATEVGSALRAGRKCAVAGLGTFSTCTRKATADRPACTMAMFRASADLRSYVSGGPPPQATGPHAQAVHLIAGALQQGEALDLPALGHMAAVPVKGKAPKIIFHGSPELNDTL